MCAKSSMCSALAPAGVLPMLDASLITYLVLGGATGLKLVAYIICVALQHKSGGW